MSGPAERKSIDGVDTLHKRDRTRLWYRQIPVEAETLSPLQALAQGRPVSAVRVIKTDYLTPRGTDQLIREAIQRPRGLDDIQAMLDDAAQTDEQDQTGTDETSALTDWRDAPTHSPVLLLSASAILDARNPGPILGPGTRYRILSVDDGVVALQVATLDGHISTGYCNSIDLICFEPDIAYYRRERQTGKLGTARLNLNKISQRISGVTASLVS